MLFMEPATLRHILLSTLANIRNEIAACGSAPLVCNIGALIIRIGFGGLSYFNYDKEPPAPCSNKGISYESYFNYDKAPPKPCSNCSIS